MTVPMIQIVVISPIISLSFRGIDIYLCGRECEREHKAAKDGIINTSTVAH